MEDKKVVVTTRAAGGKVERKELTKSKLVKLDRGMLRKVQVDMIKTQEDKKNETKNN